MERINFVRYVFTVGISFICSPAILKAFSNKNLPNVLLIGDSISIGYTSFVQKILKDKANVYRPINENGKPENCSGTKNGVQHLERWIGDGKWDIIHFNFGLHDLKHVDPVTGEGSTNPKDPLQSDLRQYKENLSHIVDRLKGTNAKLIFATTTPVPNRRVKPYREPQNVVKYNKAAVKIMKKENILVNDLYTFTLPVLSKIQRRDNVHFTERGRQFLAERVSEKLLSSLFQSD